MDNSNDPNSFNLSGGSNPPAVDPSFPSTTDAPLPTWPQSTPSPDNNTAASWPSAFPSNELPNAQVSPSPTDISGLSSNPDPNPWSPSDPAPQSTPATDISAAAASVSNPWLTPAQPNLSSTVPTNIPSEPAPSSDPLSTGGLSSQTTTPTLNLEPPSAFPADARPARGNEPSLTNLDNPWNTPIQTPPVEQAGQSVQPSWTSIPTEQPPKTEPPTAAQHQTTEQTTVTEQLQTNDAQPQTEQPQTQDQNSPPPPVATDAAPTDLSHLISSNQPGSSSTAPETLFVPSTVSQSPEVPNLQAENHKPIPKWLIALGGVLLVVVLGVSAYFILGVGRKTETTSLPATVSQENTESKPASVANPTAEPSAEPESANSGNFGDLQGSGRETPPQGSSAAEILRQRQQQQAQTP